MLAKELAPDTQETCVTYNMLKLTRQLFSWTADPAMADQHDVTAEAGDGDRLAAARLRRRLGIGGIGLLGAPHGETVERLHQQRIEQDRENGAGQDETARAFGQ